ncbi:hypothetical protein ACJX0J_030463, partial [Zea mays]
FSIYTTGICLLHDIINVICASLLSGQLLDQRVKEPYALNENWMCTSVAKITAALIDKQIDLLWHHMLQPHLEKLHLKLLFISFGSIFFSILIGHDGEAYFLQRTDVEEGQPYIIVSHAPSIPNRIITLKGSRYTQNINCANLIWSPATARATVVGRRFYVKTNIS